jgi:hypothetical protein
MVSFVGSIRFDGDRIEVRLRKHGPLHRRHLTAVPCFSDPEESATVWGDRVRPF